jgi:hypothetical protein
VPDRLTTHRPSRVAASVAAATLFLAGCLGPFPAIPDGTIKHPRVVLATRPAAPGREAQRLLTDETDFTAAMPLTPEGPTRKFPVVFRHHYYLQVGEAEPRELGFLTQSGFLDDRTGLRAIFPVADSDEWVAIQHHEKKYHPEERLDLPHRFAVGSFTVIHFTSRGMVSDREVAAAVGGSRFSLLPGTRTLRFWRNDGWWWLDLRTGAEKPEPNRVAEVAPGPHGITLPGTPLRVVFELPEFSPPDVRLRSKPGISLGDEGYTFGVVIGAEDRKLFGADGVGFSLRYGKDHQGGPTPTTAEILSGYAKLNPVPFRSGQFYRMEETLRGSPESGFPARRAIRYVADLKGTPLEIQLVLPLPLGRWADALARFEATLRIED